MNNELDVSVATQLVSGAVGFNLSQLCVGVADLQLHLNDQACRSC
ncbi:hypothetical protein ABZV93_00725 [Actinopolymorpha sp. NPDC004070]